METESKAVTAQIGGVVIMPHFTNVTGNVSTTIINNMYGHPPSGLKTTAPCEFATDRAEMQWTPVTPVTPPTTPVTQNEMLHQEPELLPIQHSDDQKYLGFINCARQQPCAAWKRKRKRHWPHTSYEFQESLVNLLLGEIIQDFFYLLKPKKKVIDPYSFYYVSPIKTLKRLLSDSTVFDKINTRPQRCQQEGFLCNIVDGSLFKSHPLFSQKPSALPIIIFADEVEIMPRNKLLRFYYTFANIDPKYRSEFIAPLAAANVNDIDEGGVRVILDNILKDFESLYEGVKCKTPNSKMYVFGAVVSLCSKTLELAGFKVDFARERAQEQTQGIMKKHTVRLFKTPGAIRDLLKSAFKPNHRKNRGKKLVSLIHQSPYDMMQIITERVVPMEIKCVLKHLIMSKQIDLNWISLAIQDFPYSPIDMDDKPDPISVITMASNDDKPHQTPGKMLILLKTIPFLLSSVKKTPYVQLALDLCEIVQRFSAPVLSVKSVETLKTMIEKHVKQFKELFPLNDVTSEQHYMLHLPDQILSLGPPVWHRSRRLEPNLNLQNVFQLLLDHKQHFECCPNDIECPVVEDEKELGPASEGANTEHVTTKVRSVSGIDSIRQVEAVEWIHLNGNKYISGESMVITNTKGDAPVFGLIENIYVIDSSWHYFNCLPYETLGLHRDLLAYEVAAPNPAPETQLISVEKLIDHTSYFPVSFKNHVYVQIQYNLTDVIALKNRN
ncbi:hypothetical protein INR49_018358 [Caranx melampygus]|nr:hypothetical protein INR49_018358 [Caranx melampygus]